MNEQEKQQAVKELENLINVLDQSFNVMFEKFCFENIGTHEHIVLCMSQTRVY